MTKELFEILFELNNGKKTADLEVSMGMLKSMETEGFICKGEITNKGVKELDKFKVDNAIIMAAGFGLRSMPLSRIVPKGLYEVKGQILIERQIEQLLEAGIKEIIIVTGYLKEKFEYLKEKYNVIIIENDDYYRYNNISSLYVARKFLKNSYVCCSDNYFAENVFRNYVFDSYYSCKYSKEYLQEYFITKNKGEYILEIQKGGKEGWYTIGEAFFSENFSTKFVELLEKEYEETEVKRMLWDDFHIRHINQLPLRYLKYDSSLVQEFDTLEDIVEFDESFVDFERNISAQLEQLDENIPAPLKRYEDIERYNSATTNQHEGRLHLNENTFGPSPRCIEALKEITCRDLYEYDMSTDDFLVKKLSRFFSVPEDDIYLHNGSAEILKSVFSLVLEKGDTVLLPEPGWSYYNSLAKEQFCDVALYNVLEDEYKYYIDIKDLFKKASEYKPKLIVITSPHNPTGCKINSRILEQFICDNPESLVLVDQAYAGFYEEDLDIRRIVESYTNVLVSRTFSKYFGLANMRLGFAFCNHKMKRIWGLDLPLFRENIISRKMAVAALDDKKYYEQMNRKLNNAKDDFINELNSVKGIRAYESFSNFVAVSIANIDMLDLQKELAEKGYMIRLFKDHSDFIARIAISDVECMRKVAKIIIDYYQEQK